MYFHHQHSPKAKTALTTHKTEGIKTENTNKILVCLDFVSVQCVCVCVCSICVWLQNTITLLLTCYQHFRSTCSPAHSTNPSCVKFCPAVVSITISVGICIFIHRLALCIDCKVFHVLTCCKLQLANIAFPFAI